ncbi:MAG: TIGR03111 family XrtG-associated glycosyltransferase [Solirubrobacterales bacterium]
MLELFLDRVIAFVLFWGVWMLAPLLIDAATAAIYISFMFIYSDQDEDVSSEDVTYYPRISIVIPIHNSADTLGACLQSIFRQTYPVSNIQIICVNNGTTDNSFEIYGQIQHDHPHANLTWVDMDRAGKSIALNAGLYLMNGEYVINLDSDAWLDRRAIWNVVAAFEKDHDLVAATGAIHIDKELGKGSSFLDVIHYCEAIEYLVAFQIGRRYQTFTNKLFTLSGAFSVFRRDVILKTFLYSERTVSEDTDLTFHIRNQSKGSRLACISNAVAYVEPISSMKKLYSQRVRWQRGQIEVSAMYGSEWKGFLQALASFTGRILIEDHTLAFSRLTWTFLVPFMYFLGYPLPLVFAAIGGLILCYMFLDALYFLVAYRGASNSYRKELRRIWWVVFFLPIFRYFTYWFRLGGIVLTVTEKAGWGVTDPFEQLQKAFRKDINQLKKEVARIRKRLGLADPEHTIHEQPHGPHHNG